MPGLFVYSHVSKVHAREGSRHCEAVHGSGLLVPMLACSPTHWLRQTCRRVLLSYDPAVLGIGDLRQFYHSSLGN